MFTLTFATVSKVKSRLRSRKSLVVEGTTHQRQTASGHHSTTATPTMGGNKSHMDEMQACVVASPLLSSCGLTVERVGAEMSRILEITEQMMKNLSMPSFEEMNETQRERIFQYYLPVFLWCEDQLKQYKTEHKGQGPMVLGISAPQGCGKSTLCEQLEALFEYFGYTAASISIDDFYKTREDQVALSQRHAGNRLLEFRGNAGSHDLKLGTTTLSSLKQATTKTASVSLPRYDKSLHKGKGDRGDVVAWPIVKGPVDIVLFEGWMLGFSSVGRKEAIQVDEHLGAVDEYLESYKTAWDSFVDVWLVVKVSDPQFSYKWRLQAEHRMRDAGKPAMTDDEVATFVDRFMPSYRCYLPGLYSKGPTTAKKGKLLVVEVNEQRSPVAVQPASIRNSR